MDYLVGILHKYGLATNLEVNWHKSMVNWCGQTTQLCWLEKFQLKWATNGDLSKLFGNPFDLHLQLQNVDQFLVVKSQTHVVDFHKFVTCCQNLHYEQVCDVMILAFHCTVHGQTQRKSYGILGFATKSPMTRSENMAIARVNWDNCTYAEESWRTWFYFVKDIVRVVLSNGSFKHFSLASQVYKLC